MTPAQQMLLPTAKNGVLGAVTDLGMGDDLRSQVEAQILEQKKKALLAVNQGGPAYGASTLGTGQKMGLGNQTLGTWALLGQGGFRG